MLVCGVVCGATNEFVVWCDQIKWLQQNNAEEDRRTGTTPTQSQLAEREAVAAKALYCVIPTGSDGSGHAMWQSQSAFLHTFYPHLAITSDSGTAAAVGQSCPACPQCAVCPAPPPAAPATPAPAPPPVRRSEKRVISFGLYGADPKYVNGAFRNAELTPSVFPGWVMRVYHDDSVPGESLQRLRSMGVELVRMEKERGSIAGMFWRFLVADDASVDRYIVRDSDSRLNEREARAVDAWIASGKSYHILRDHPSHSNFKISGGIWGGVHDPTLKLGERMKKHDNKNDYIEDVSTRSPHPTPHHPPPSLTCLCFCFCFCFCIRCTFWVV